MILRSIKQAATEYDATIAKAKSLKLPMSASDLAFAKSAPDSENLAPLLSEISAILASIPSSDSLIEQIRLKAANVTSVDEQTRLLMPFGSLLGSVGALRSKTFCDFETDWDSVPWTDVNHPSLKALRSISKVLAARAISSSHLGRFEEALDDLSTILHLAGLVGERPLLIYTLVQIACRAMAINAMKEIACCAKNSEPALAIIQQFLDRFPPSPRIADALPYEFYWALAQGRSEVAGIRLLFRQGHKPFMSKTPKHIYREGGPRDPLMRGLMTRPLQQMISLVEGLQRCDSDIDRLKIVMEIESHGYKARGLDYKLLRVGPRGAITAVQHAIVMNTAQLLVTKALVAVLNYRVKHGLYPQSLDEAGFHELDPFNQSPLTLRCESGKCRVICSDRFDEADLGAFVRDLKLVGRLPLVEASCVMW